MLSDVPSFCTGSTFLDANAQAHHKPLSAFGDLTDNARDADANHLWIDSTQDDDGGKITITITDDGRGMSEHRLRTGIGGIGHSDKEHRAEVHYGMGAKSALPRISSSSLVFSKDGKHRTVALISTTLSRALGSDELKVPVATWATDTDALLDDTADDAPLSREQRWGSLQVLLKHTPFTTEESLLAEFDRIPHRTGTRLVLYRCEPGQFDVTEAGDVRITTEGEQASGGGAAAAHVTSLRAYLSVLYYADSTDGVMPTMQISLRGISVPPRDWTAFLNEWPSGRAPYSYTPKVLLSDGDERTYGAKARFGTMEPLDEILKVLSARGGGNRNGVLKQQKDDIEKYTGVFYYNHDRMIMALERLPKQVDSNTGSIMMTTEKKLTIYGIGIVGVCREGFLTPEHNKAGYEAKSYEPSVFAKPSRPSFQDLHKVQINDFLKKHLKEVMTPAFQAAKQRALALTKAPGTGGGEQQHHQQQKQEQLKRQRQRQQQLPQTAIAGIANAPKSKRKRPAETDNDDDDDDDHVITLAKLEEGGRYRLRLDPRVVGAVCKTGSGWVCLTLDSGHRSQNVRPADLEYIGFEKVQLPVGFVLADGHLLNGALVTVTWKTASRSSSSSGGGGGGSAQPMMCRLRPSDADDKPASPGACCAQYFDGMEEELYVAIRPSDDVCLVYDEHGVELTLNSDDPRVANCVQIDEARLERAAAALRDAAPANSGRVDDRSGGARGGGGGGSSSMHSDAAGYVPPSLVLPSVPLASPSTLPTLPTAIPEVVVTDVPSLLRHARLSQYADRLLDDGWDDLLHLQSMSASAMDVLAAGVAMKPGHLARLKTALEKLAPEVEPLD